jgi:hypothetical protein
MKIFLSFNSLENAISTHRYRHLIKYERATDFILYFSGTGFSFFILPKTARKERKKLKTFNNCCCEL